MCITDLNLGVLFKNAYKLLNITANKISELFFIKPMYRSDISVWNYLGTIWNSAMQKQTRIYNKSPWFSIWSDISSNWDMNKVGVILCKENSFISYQNFIETSMQQAIPWSSGGPVYLAYNHHQCLYSLSRHRVIGIGIPIINLGWSSDHHRFIMGIPTPIRLCKMVYF